MNKRLVLAFILLAYIALVIKVMVFKDIEIKTPFLILKLGADHGDSANFVPFKTIWPYLRGDNGRFIAILNLVGNIAPFVPIGFLVPLIYRNMTWRKSLALAVAVGLTMEGMEAVFRVGRVDIDDVILNAFGVTIGYWIFTILVERSGYPRIQSSDTA